MCYVLNLLLWNENSQRLSTSERRVFDLRRPDRRTPTKVLVKKSYQFVGKVWKEYFDRNKQDHRWVYTQTVLANHNGLVTFFHWVYM